MALIPAVKFTCPEGGELEFIKQVAKDAGVQETKVKKARRVTRKPSEQVKISL